MPKRGLCQVNKDKREHSKCFIQIKWLNYILMWKNWHFLVAVELWLCLAHTSSTANMRFHHLHKLKTAWRKYYLIPVKCTSTFYPHSFVFMSKTVCDVQSSLIKSETRTHPQGLMIFASSTGCFYLQWQCKYIEATESASSGNALSAAVSSCLGRNVFRHIK